MFNLDEGIGKDFSEIANDLEQRCGVTVRVIAADMAEPDTPQSLFDKLNADGVVIDGLVNNAGYGLKGTFLKSDWARNQKQRVHGFDETQTTQDSDQAERTGMLQQAASANSHVIVNPIVSIIAGPLLAVGCCRYSRDMSAMTCDKIHSIHWTR